MFIFFSFNLNLISDITGESKPETVWLLAFGATSGFCGQSLSYPLDIVRRRMQTDVITKENYHSILGTLKKIYRYDVIEIQ